MIEKFTVSVYSTKCNANTVSKARRILFTQGKRAIESLSPTSGALKQHLKRARYQAFI